MISQRFGNKTRNYIRRELLGHGFFVSTVGLDEEIAREYIRNQDERDKYFKQ